MLVLTRKVGEGIAIGDEIKIVVMQVKGKQVRLGIKASPSTAVHREEIFQRIQDENRAASQSSGEGLSAAGDVFATKSGIGEVPVRRQTKSGKGPSADNKSEGKNDQE